MLLKTIEKDFQEAIKTGEPVHLNALRGLRTALHNKEIELRPKEKELTDEVVIEVIRREIKKRKEAIEMFKKGERLELAEKEKKELLILNQYLPEDLSDDKVKEVVLKAIKQIKAVGPQDFGKVMGKVMGQIKGRVEASKVREIVQEQLNNLIT